MRRRSTMSSPPDTPGGRQWRKVGALGCGPWRGFAGAQIRFRARAGLGLAIFFSEAVVALAPAGGLKAADGFCPGEGATRGRVVSIDERLELTLENGIRLKIAGVDPPRPTPGDPDLDFRARDRLAQWLVGQEILFRPLEPGPDRWGRVVAFVFAFVRAWPLGGSVLCDHRRGRSPVLRREGWLIGYCRRPDYRDRQPEAAHNALLWATPGRGFFGHNLATQQQNIRGGLCNSGWLDRSNRPRARTSRYPLRTAN